MQTSREAEVKHISSTSAHSMLLPQSPIVLNILLPVTTSWKTNSQKCIINMHACTYTHMHSTFSRDLSPSVFLQLPYLFAVYRILQHPHYVTSFTLCINPAGKQPAQIVLNSPSPSHHKLSFKPFLETKH